LEFSRQTLQGMLADIWGLQKSSDTPCLLTALPSTLRRDLPECDVRNYLSEKKIVFPVMYSWKDYYCLRGLPETSPVALIMDAALTTASAIQRYLKGMPNSHGDSASPITVMLLGMFHICQ